MSTYLVNRARLLSLTGFTVLWMSGGLGVLFTPPPEPPPKLIERPILTQPPDPPPIGRR